MSGASATSVSLITRSWQVFARAPGARPVSVLACVLLAGFFNMTSMGALLPVMSQLAPSSDQRRSHLEKVMLDGLERVGVSPTMGNLVLLVALLLVTKSLCQIAAMSYVAQSVARTQSEIRRLLLRGVLEARWGYFLEQPPARLSTAISAQATAAGEAYYWTAQAYASAIQALALLLVAFFVSGTMVLITFVAALVISYPLHRLVVMSRDSGGRQWTRTNDLGSSVQDTIGNMKAIKAMDASTPFQFMIGKFVKDLERAYFGMLFSRHLLSYGQDILVVLTISAGFYIGNVIFHTPFSDLIVLGIIFYQVMSLLRKLQESLQLAIVAQEAYFGVIDMIDEVRSHEERHTGTVRPMLTSEAALDDVTFAYGSRIVLDDVSLAIPKNSITVLFGPSGSGKTTIIDLVIGLLVPQSGRILLDGVDLRDVDMRAWRRMVGYVPQDLTLLHANVRDNVTLGDATIDDRRIEEALRLAGALAFVRALPNGLDTHIGNMGGKLSGGERQRLSLARALARKPKLLVLDEVTSSLDEATEAEVCSQIAALRKDFTIVAITHRPAWKSIAQRLYLVSEGKVERLSASGSLEVV
ncbi:MAG: ABC transporter ATP-binding protein [Hyphomicrobiales bacterium]